METLVEILWFSWHYISGPAAKQRSPPGWEDFHFTFPSCAYCLSLTFYLPNNYTVALFLFLDEMKPRHSWVMHVQSDITAYAAVNENIIQIIINGLDTMLRRDDYHRLSTGLHPSAHSDIPASSLPVASRHSSGFWLHTQNINYWHFQLQPEVDRPVFWIYELKTAKWAPRLTTNHSVTELMSQQQGKNPNRPSLGHEINSVMLYMRMDKHLCSSSSHWSSRDPFPSACIFC